MKVKNIFFKKIKDIKQENNNITTSELTNTINSNFLNLFISDGEKYFIKSKKYRLKGKFKNAFDKLKLSYEEGYIFSYYMIYFYISGLIGNNAIIRKDLKLEGKLNKLMKENVFYVENEVKNKNVDALLIIASLYLEGIIYSKNPNKAKEYLYIGSDLNCGICTNLLGVILENEKNNKCLDYYKKACDLGNLQARNNFAWLYKEGKFLEKNIYEYLEIQEDLANDFNDFYLAQYCLGKYYYEEVKDFKKAFGYFRRAAKKDHIPSMEILSDFYEDGIHVNKDMNQYLFWRSKIEM